MPHNLSAISYFVDDYDSAIDYFTHTLGFTLSGDKSTGKDSRFVLVTPRGSSASILLMRASNEEERALIGKQAADRVFMILASEDFWRDYDTFKQKGVEFLEINSDQETSGSEGRYGVRVSISDVFLSSGISSSPLVM